MSPAQCATKAPDLVVDAEPPQAQPALAQQKLAEKTRKRVFVSFAGTVAIGLVLAGWYVGNRIYAADGSQAPASSAGAAQPAAIPPPAAPATALAIPARAPAPPALYLETVSLGDTQDVKFLSRLESKGYAAVTENGRIRIGPFTDTAALLSARSRLAGAGILATESAR